jgi:hypothetical protein
MAKVNATTPRCFARSIFNRTEFDLQVGLRVDLQNRDIERPLLEVCPDGQWRFVNDISLPRP